MSTQNNLMWRNQWKNLYVCIVTTNLLPCTYTQLHILLYALPTARRFHAKHKTTYYLLHACCTAKIFLMWRRKIQLNLSIILTLFHLNKRNLLSFLNEWLCKRCPNTSFYFWSPFIKSPQWEQYLKLRVPMSALIPLRKIDQSHQRRLKTSAIKELVVLVIIMRKLSSTLIKYFAPIFVRQ